MSTVQTPADIPPADANAPSALFAAAVYVPRSRRGDALPRFIDSLKASGVKVGGLLQEEVLNPDGSRDRIDTIDINTGRRIVINQSTRSSLENHDCSLDVSALAETTSVLRQAINDGAELIVVEKFGSRNQRAAALPMIFSRSSPPKRRFWLPCLKPLMRLGLSERAGSGGVFNSTNSRFMIGGRRWRAADRERPLF
jgi:hypothetical protein